MDYQYTISENVTPADTLPPATLPGVMGSFDVALPVDESEYVRKLMPGDTITFIVGPSWTKAKMHVRPSHRSFSKQLPFAGTSPFDVMPDSNGVPFKVTVNDQMGAWQIWFKLESANGIHLIADPEVQTQTGGPLDDDSL